MKKQVALFCLIAVAVPCITFAQELHQEVQGVWRAEAVEASPSEAYTVLGTDAVGKRQTVTARIMEGEREGETVVFENDYIQLAEGDTFFMNYLVTIDGAELYSVREIDRRGSLLLLTLLFVVMVLLFGGWQGVRSLLSLAASLLAIVYVLLPALMAGYSPVLVSLGVAMVILFFAIVVTHGWNRLSLIAFSGTVIAIGITVLFTSFFVGNAGLTGFASDESVYLNIGTGGSLDFVGLLIGAIIIGALGALDDIAVTQVAVVRELYATNRDLSVRTVYRKAIRVGKEHVGALVNTLVLAYAGAALPLLLWFSTTSADFLNIVNREIFATEIVRTLLGSIGLILTVPITTYLGARFLREYEHLDDETVGHFHSH